ncbi:MAG: phosphoheptose isomerase [Porticoccaceae bacterium]|nr:MAG: phosphoheptose isomerase [Porticoccaceae bacterium]
MESSVIEQFHQSIEAKMACGEALAPLIASASSRVVQQLLQEHKILTCGNGLSASLSNMFTQSLMLQYKLERPGFPAICLNSNCATITAIGHHHSMSEIFSKQIRTLGQPGDLLVIFSNGTNPSDLVQAIQTAHDRSMSVIGFTGTDDTDLSALLSGEDIEIRVDHHDLHRISEIQLLSLFCLCELIDQQLFGETP